MHEVLEAYLKRPEASTCAVGTWILEQDEQFQELFRKIEQHPNLNRNELYRDLSAESVLPFKMTLFRMHMRGDCACKNA